MKNKEYWNRRFLMDKALIINDAEQFLQDNLKTLFTVAAKEIEGGIEALYQSFTDQNKVSLAEAKRIINHSDFAKVDFEEMAKHKVNIDKDLKKKKDNLPGDLVAKMEKEHENYEKMLAGYTKKGQITHLELLHVKIDKKILDMYDENQVNIYELLAKQYENSYYKEVFNTQQCIGFGKDFIALNDNAIHTAILNQYLRKDFSDTIYKHRENLSKDFRENLTVGIIRGENLNKMAKRINNRMDVGLSNAKRLVRTETAYIFEQATKKAYEVCDMEEYEYLATLDYKTSDICKPLDGKVFRVKDAVPGKNYPPMHPNCRSTTICHFENDKVTTRIARDISGKSYEVPSDMQYKDWYKKYIVAEHKDAIINMTDKEKYALNNYVGIKSYLLNEKLRTGEVLSKKEKSFIRDLDRALNKFPEYKGDVSRSLYFNDEITKFEFLKEYQVGKTVSSTAYTSTTRGGIYNSQGQVQTYILNAKKGKDISSFNKKEQEVVYKRKQEFMVKEIEEIDGVIHILLEEL